MIWWISAVTYILAVPNTAVVCFSTAAVSKYDGLSQYVPQMLVVANVLVYDILRCPV
jgi:hypothetical protein